MRFFLSLILFFSFNVLGAELKLPALTSPVMDLGGFLQEAQKRDLSELAYEIYTNQGPQITILTVPDLQGYPIEDFSIEVVEKWQLGSKEKDNGLLVIIAKAERQMRIEVGNGIEGEITDFDTAKFTKEIFPEFFRRGDYHGGLRLFMQDVAQKFNIKTSEGGSRIVRRAPQTIPKINLGLIIILMIVLSLIGLIFRRKPGLRGFTSGLGVAAVGGFMGLPIVLLFMMFVFGSIIGLIGLGNFLVMLASSRGGRYGGGGSFGGGGGWSGGGGGFSGGGSSGSW